jgi:hypothetical protein
MGKLRDAIKHLTDLKVRLITQTTIATTDITNKQYDLAEALLDVEIKRTNECLNEVQRARSSSSRKESDPKFDTLAGLQAEVVALRDNMGALKTQCAAGRTEIPTKATAKRLASVEASHQTRTEAASEIKRQEKAVQETRGHEGSKAFLPTEVEVPPKTAVETLRQTETERLPHVEVAMQLPMEDNRQSTESSLAIAPIVVVDEASPNEEQIYTSALKQLKEYKFTPYSKDIDDCLTKLIVEVEKLKDKERTSDLIEALEKTYRRLTTPYPPEQYEAIARSMQGKPSTGLKAIGSLMIALAVALAALAIVFAPALLGLAAAVALTGTAATVTTGAVVTTTSTAIAATGIGIFAQGFKQKGISAAMSNVNKAKLAQTKEQFTTSMD